MKWVVMLIGIGLFGIVISLTGCGHVAVQQQTQSEVRSEDLANDAGVAWVTLPDGGEVLCVSMGYRGGVSCDWSRVRG